MDATITTPGTSPASSQSADVAPDVGALGRVLGTWAHPDDETYLSGGLMAAASRSQQPTMCVTATSGEHGTTDPIRWPPERLSRRRRRELCRALDILGLDHRVQLGYPDGELANVDPARGIDELTGQIERCLPDTVVTFGLDGFTGHCDHQVIGEWATTAAHLVEKSLVLHTTRNSTWIEQFDSVHRRFPIFSPGYPLPVDDHDIVLDLVLDDDALDQKTRALLAHGTQTDAIIAALGCSQWREWFRRETFVEAAVRAPRVMSAAMDRTD
jgi:LmbE family N-acetylglucosaminyl deacetylase